MCFACDGHIRPNEREKMRHAPPRKKKKRGYTRKTEHITLAKYEGLRLNFYSYESAQKIYWHRMSHLVNEFKARPKVSIVSDRGRADYKAGFWLRQVEGNGARSVHVKMQLNLLHLSFKGILPRPDGYPL